MRQIGITKPHICRRGRNGYWYCAMRGMAGTGVGYTPAAAYKDWNAWICLPATGHSFMPVKTAINSPKTVSANNSLKTVGAKDETAQI
jgi:hypothetical protein